MEEAAKKFLSIELKIKEHIAAVKSLKEEKEGVETMLKSLMENEKIEQINLDNHCIVIKNTKQYGSLNKEYIENGLVDFLKIQAPRESQEFATKATEHLISNREITEKSVVKVLTKRR